MLFLNKFININKIETGSKIESHTPLEGRKPCASAQCIAFSINFQDTFTNQKILLHLLFCSFYLFFYSYNPYNTQ